jgi:hypothetical protein
MTGQVFAHGSAHQPGAAETAAGAPESGREAPEGDPPSGSYWPFGRKAHEKPDDLTRKEQEVLRKRKAAEQEEASPEVLEALDLKLSEIRLRREIAVKRASRDHLRSQGDTQKAGRLDAQINGLKTRLEAVRVKQRRADDADHPSSSTDGNGGGGGGAGSSHGGSHH